jgi:hypothetical protein
MLARHGVIVGRDDREFVRETTALYDDIVDRDWLADRVLLAGLSAADRLRVEQHRAALAKD